MSDIVAKDCFTQGVCDVKGAIFDNILVENLPGDGLLLWGCALRHVRLTGDFAGINIIPHLTSGALLYAREKRRSDPFVADNVTFYKSVDWALDIREARFGGAVLAGVPGELVIRDPTTQFLVHRDRLLSHTLQDIYFDDVLPVKCDLEDLLQSERTSEVFVVPELDLEARNAVRRVLEELREAGIAE
jgi:hypothetical protein